MPRRFDSEEPFVICGRLLRMPQRQHNRPFSPNPPCLLGQQDAYCALPDVPFLRVTTVTYC
jgi:hypothetical protein